MTIYAGGRRSRLIRESFTRMLYDALDELDWFNPAAQHKPVTFTFDPVDYQVELVPNVIAIGDDDYDTDEWEIGSQMAEHRWIVYIDVYAENSAVGIHLSHDIKAILDGRFPSVGRSDPSFPVYDWSMATPPQIFVAQLENITLNRGRAFNRPWERFWYMLSMEIVDYYGTEDDG